MSVLSPAIGCMRLSTTPDVADDEARGIAVITAALDAGVRLLDTADAYAPGPAEIGHNERLIRKALAAWGGDTTQVVVATKGGLTRPGGQWVPDGRAKHLRAACEASLTALGVDRISLYQLHAVDPKTALATSVRALAKLQRDGLVQRVGLCNVNLAQLRRAQELVEVASVQVELSAYNDDAIRGGVVAHCLEHGIEVLGYRPLGGVARVARLDKHAVIGAVARRHDCSPAQVVLAWWATLGSGVRPVAGPTTEATARACATSVELSTEDIAELDAVFCAVETLRRPLAARRPPDDADGDVVLVAGMPGSGKSTHTKTYLDRHYERLNRDLIGGRLAGLIPRLDEHLAEGRKRVVLDNTYGTRARRNHVIETAWRHGVPVRCVWVDTPIERARVFAVTRMLERYGELLTPETMRAVSKDDPNAFPPRVQLEFQRNCEPPEPDEGFAEIERIVPEPARPDPAGARALVLDVDKLLGKDAAGEVAEPLRSRLVRCVAEGWVVTGFAWRPDGSVVGDGLAEALSTPVFVAHCHHGAGPPVCWCRPPMPGLVLLALRHVGASAANSVLVGDSAAAERYARAVGLDYATPATLP